MGPPSSFDRLRMRATPRRDSVENLILSLSKDEVFEPQTPLRYTGRQAWATKAIWASIIADSSAAGALRQAATR